MARNDAYLKKAPKTMTLAEQDRLLRITKDHRHGLRDHVIYALALGTGLREFEIVALDIHDVFTAQGKVRQRIHLRTYKTSNDDPGMQFVFVPDSLRYKLAGYLKWKKAQGEGIAPEDALFCSNRSKRISERALRHNFTKWMSRMGYAKTRDGRQPFTFHSLRHTCGTNLWRATHDIRVVQRQLRHASIISTTIYATPSDEDMHSAVQDLNC